MTAAPHIVTSAQEENKTEAPRRAGGALRQGDSGEKKNQHHTFLHNPDSKYQE